MTWEEYCQRPEKVWHKFSPCVVADKLYDFMTCDLCKAKDGHIELVVMRNLEKHFDEHEGIFTDGNMVWTK